MTNMPKKDLLSVVIPAHNEEGGLIIALKEIIGVVSDCDVQWEIIVIDDGSHDNTFKILRDFAENYPQIKGVRFSRNFGKESALLAGLNLATGNAVITMDSDLQHPPSIIPLMLAKWREGNRIVDGVKRSRENDGVITRFRAKIFNLILTKLGGVDLQDSSDFKLLDRLIVDTIVNQLPEKQRFYRGLTDWIGFKRDRVLFDVEDRLAGEGKWSTWGLVKLAVTATVSFTSAPLQIVTALGFITLITGFFITADALNSWFHGVAVSGFATIIITLLIIGSFIMISLGVLGVYIAKIYDEIKSRPQYIIEAELGFNSVTEQEK